MHASIRRMLLFLVVLLLLFALVRIGTSTYENLTRIPQ